MLLSDDKSAGSRKLAGADRESRWCKAHLWFSQYTWTGSGMAGRGQRGGSRAREKDLVRFGTGIHRFNGFSVQF